MTLEQRLILLAQAIGADIKALNISQGALTDLDTTAKASLVAAVNELKGIVDGLGGGGAVINDAAGDGDTTVTWSADKIFDTIAAASAALKNELTNGVGTALDTLKELADALGNDPSFAATIASEIANRVRYDAAQALSAPQQAQARTNIGAQAAADVGNTDHDFVADYNTAKEALRALTRSAAREWAEHGITVNAICPAAVTPAYERFRSAAPELAKRMLEQNPMGYMGDAEQDIGGVAAFLACDDARYLTGNTLFVDGGSHINGVQWAPPLPPE